MSRGPQYLNANGSFTRYKPQTSHFSRTLPRWKPNMINPPKKTISPETAKALAQALKGFLR